MPDQDFIKQLQGKSEPELRKELADEREKLWQLSIDLRAGKVKNVAEIQLKRKMIARILTVITARFPKARYS